jgi:hypothetical protein
MSRVWTRVFHSPLTNSHSPDGLKPRTFAPLRPYRDFVSAVYRATSLAQRPGAEAAAFFSVPAFRAKRNLTSAAVEFALQHGDWGCLILYFDPIETCAVFGGRAPTLANPSCAGPCRGKTIPALCTRTAVSDCLWGATGDQVHGGASFTIPWSGSAGTAPAGAAEARRSKGQGQLPGGRDRCLRRRT